MHGSRFLILFLVLFISTAPLSAGQTSSRGLFDRHGLTLMHGRSAWTNLGPEPAVRYEWSTAGYLLTRDLSPWFSLETQIGAGYLKAEGRGDSPSAELRLLGDVHYQWLFLQLGCGIAHVFDPDALPGLAETKTHSILSGTAGFRIPIGSTDLSLGYGVEHISAISKNGSEGDTGWNAGGPRLALTWRF